MKVETPQILWNSEGDKGINAALYSVSLVESGFVEDDSGIRKPSYVLATAGNSPDIHLWKIVFAQDESSASSTPSLWQRGRPTQIDFLCRLHRHEGAVNSVAFSPDGLSLATAGETGAVIVWSVPLQKRGNGNGQHWWSHVEREQDLQVRVLSRNAEAVSDISWSADSQRFVAGTIDSAIFVCQATPEGNWETVYRTKEHSHYVQGVAYDPCGVYLASMSNDRTVRVYTRKPPAKSKKKVQRPKEATGAVPPPDFSARVANLLSEARLEMNVRTKQIKHFKQTDSTTGAVLQKHSLFCDEATLQSFFRRLAWTPDGAFLILPACLWQHKMPLDTGSINHTAASQEAPSYATCLFMRHHFDEPYRVLTGLEKPSVAIRPNPILFELPSCVKENKQPTSKLPYRSIFCVLTTDSVLVYDTVQASPLAVLRGLHYANLTDAVWSANGHELVVSSTDGYLSMVRFAPGELGTVYTPPQVQVPISGTPTSKEAPEVTTPASVNLPSAPAAPVLPPTEVGTTTVLEGRPAKKMKRITPVPVTNVKRKTEDLPSVEDLSLVEPKKKKRIQPTLLASNQ